MRKGGRCFDGAAAETGCGEGGGTEGGPRGAVSLWGQAGRAMSDDGAGAISPSANDNASEPGHGIPKTSAMGRAGAMIGHFLVGLLTGSVVGAFLGMRWGVRWGALTMGILAARRVARRWTVQCGDCHATREAGPRRQLYLEVWDSYGNMYEKFPVGAGEMLNTRAVDPSLMAQVRSVVQRINAETGAAKGLQLLKGSSDRPTWDDLDASGERRK
jgi:hypothetical protein